MSSVLAPLAERYLDWLSLPAHATADTADEQQDEVRAMPMILRIERTEPASRTALLEAAASAAIAVCLDERAQVGGPWHESMTAWIAGRIRKVARRARGAHWLAAQDFPGVTSVVGDAQVRALVPGRVRDLPRQISRLQISGSEPPLDKPPNPPSDQPLLLLNPAVPMSVGKAAAQVGHGAMILAALLDEGALADWAAGGYRCAVRTATAEQWRGLHPGENPAQAWHQHRVVAVRDAGFTEVDPGTITVLAQWVG